MFSYTNIAFFKLTFARNFHFLAVVTRCYILIGVMEIQIHQSILSATIKSTFTLMYWAEIGILLSFRFSIFEGAYSIGLFR